MSRTGFHLFYLQYIQFDRGGTAENRHGHLDLALQGIHVSSTVPEKSLKGPSMTLTLVARR